MKTVLSIYALAIITTTGCTTDEPATSDTESKLWGLECSEPGWGFDVEDDVVDLAFESDFGCNDDPFGDPWGFGGGGGGSDPGLCSLYNGPVSGTGRGTGSATVNGTGSDAYQNALTRASEIGTSGAKFDARFNGAESKCRNSLYPAGIGLCRPRPNPALLSAQGTGCTQTGADYPDGNVVVQVECAATATVECEYEYSLF